MEKVIIKMFWGEEQSRKASERSDVKNRKEKDNDYDIVTYTFDTEGEANAFLHGVEQMSGWMDYYSVKMKS